MIRIAVIVVLALAFIYMISQGYSSLLIIAPLILLLISCERPPRIGGKKSNNALVEFTLGEFKRLGGFTTLGESVCRAAIYLQSTPKYGSAILLKTATGEKVPWLRYRAVNLEIDGLDERHRLAFEYDGPQHYNWQEWQKMGRNRHGSENVLDYYRSRFYDRWKTDLCRLRGIHLLRISTWTSFDVMRVVVANALEHPFSENRPRDDADVIDSLHEIDTRNSSQYPQLKWGTSHLTLATREWAPHPYSGENLYTSLFRQELKRFAETVHAGLLDLMPAGRPENRSFIEKKICERFDQELEQLDAYAPQLEDVRRELHRVAVETAEQLCR